jgi:hypothetical protein
VDSTEKGHDTPVALIKPNNELIIVVARAGLIKDDIRQLMHKLVT